MKARRIKYLRSREKLIKHGAASLLALFTLLGVLFSDTAAKVVYASMLYSASRVIPTLFVFMVTAKLATAFLLRCKSGWVRRRLCRLLSLSERGCTAVLLSFIGSYPIGALVLCEGGHGSVKDRRGAERELALSHNTGPSFPIAFVGGVLWGSKRLGAMIYVLQLASWVPLAMLYRRRNMQLPSFAPVVDGNCRQSFGALFSDAVCSSALSCINIAAFTAFMRYIGELLFLLLPLERNFTVAAVISSLLELSDGCVRASELGGVLGYALCGFAVCWGGLCAALQACSAASGCSLSVRPLIAFKLAHGTLCAVLCAGYASFFKPDARREAALMLNYSDRRCAAVLAGVVFLYLLTKILSAAPKDGKIS